MQARVNVRLHRCLEARVMHRVRLTRALRGGEVSAQPTAAWVGDASGGGGTSVGTVSRSSCDRLEQKSCTRLPASARKRLTKT